MTNVLRYVIDYSKVIIQRIPEALRSDEFIAWMTRLCDPFIYAYNLLIAFRANALYRLKITPQVWSLEKMLNDRYDNLLRRIYIKDGLSFDPTYEYLKAELRPNYAYRKSENHIPVKYYFLKGEIGAFTYDFVVLVPSSVIFNSDEMKGLLDNNKLAGTFYTIQTF